MRNRIELLLFALFTTVVFGCVEEPEFSDDENYLKINVNGEEYVVRNGGNKGLDIITCHEKSGYLVHVGEVDNSEVFFDLYLSHFKYLNEFEPPDIENKHYVGYFERSVSCDLDVQANFIDKVNTGIEPAIYLEDHRNYIDRVKKLDETGTEVRYAISGNFRVTYFNDGPTQILIFGEYNVMTSVLK